MLATSARVPQCRPRRGSAQQLSKGHVTEQALQHGLMERTGG
ncbi:hypothetical protein [Deinococcus detaillensis]|nr:hypothetical protein [Deinococcus detaillensis]